MGLVLKCHYDVFISGKCSVGKTCRTKLHMPQVSDAQIRFYTCATFHVIAKQYIYPPSIPTKPLKCDVMVAIQDICALSCDRPIPLSCLCITEVWVRVKVRVRVGKS